MEPFSKAALYAQGEHGRRSAVVLLSQGLMAAGSGPDAERFGHERSPADLEVVSDAARKLVGQQLLGSWRGRARGTNEAQRHPWRE